LLVVSAGPIASRSPKEERVASNADALQIVSPSDGEDLDSFLTVILRWRYPMRATRRVNGVDYPYFCYVGVSLRLSSRPDLRDPIVDAILPEDRTSYRLALLPETTYYWQLTPLDEGGERPAGAVRACFRTGTPQIDLTTDDDIRYRNPREGSHWLHLKPVEYDETEPLSPWYEIKSYRGQPLPRFERIKEALPVPVYDGYPEVLDAYWYCWKTLFESWYYEPESPDHQAVSNLCGIKSWGGWGSTMVWDTAFILHFARYGHQAYPFITALDNCYARQHENGFICRETDKDNHEVYVWFPVNPPLFAWAEWEYYRISGDKERLARVVLPIVKHYEWWMRYQRRANGVYWTGAFQEAGDSPRNDLIHYAVSANAYQALAAKCLSKIAHEIGREDLQGFFAAEHQRLGELVNTTFWDDVHQIYNDLAADGRFITELTSEVFCKHAHMYWPLIAEVATEERVEGMIKELKEPGSFYRRNGVPSLSADSAGYRGGPDGAGEYWCGSVWPPVQCMVQEGLRAYGQWDSLFDLADRYFNAVVEVFQREGTIKEYLAPDRPSGHGVADFVGWGGIAPVANLIEYILGFVIDVPARQVTWRVTKTERHGLHNIRLGDFDVDFTCDARLAADAPARITVRSGGEFSLIVVSGGARTDRQIHVGESRFWIEAYNT
jgi:hypothetical protein